MGAFSFSHTDLFLPLRLGKTARETLQEFIDIDVSAGDLVRILNENQAYRDLFFRFVSRKTAKTEKDSDAPSPTHRLINLLGMLGSRNLILALRLHRLTEGKLPDEPGDLNPSNLLRLAIEAEDQFTRNKLEYGETAHAAGVYFDLCTLLYGKNNGLKALEPYYKRCWNRAQRTGLIAQALATRGGKVAPRFALAAGMLAHAGKLHLSVQLGAEKYAEFEEELDHNDSLNGVARSLLERDKFGVTQEEVGAHSLRYFDVFRSLIPAVKNFREPYNLKGNDPGDYALAVTVGLADAMARSWKIPRDDKDPVFDEWAYPGQKLKRAELIEVMKQAMTLR
jgi:HD-like signal output (HDOD) protein